MKALTVGRSSADGVPVRSPQRRKARTPSPYAFWVWADFCSAARWTFQESRRVRMFEWFTLSCVQRYLDWKRCARQKNAPNRTKMQVRGALLLSTQSR